MEEHKVISMQQDRQNEQGWAEKKENKDLKKFLECAETIQDSLRKTGADPNTLAHLFLHFSMVLLDLNSFKELTSQGQAARKRRGKGVEQ